MFSKYFIVLPFTLLFASFSSAGIISYSYSFDANTDCDNRCYHDNSKSRLNDGLLGSGRAQYNASNNWVGWKQEAPVYLEFMFENSAQIDSIEFGGLTNHSLGTLYFDVYSNQSGIWELETNGLRTRTQDSDNRYSITGLDVTTDSIKLSFSSSDRWVLIDEVVFNGTNISIPEPEQHGY